MGSDGMVVMPGSDWVVLKLAARGQVQKVEVDTNHFKGVSHVQSPMCLLWLMAAAAAPLCCKSFGQSVSPLLACPVPFLRSSTPPVRCR